MLEHVAKLAELSGAKVAFGGKPLKGGKHSIPACYGAIEPTAVFVPLQEMLASDESFELATTEVFGPVQVRGRNQPFGEKKKEKEKRKKREDFKEPILSFFRYHVLQGSLCESTGPNFIPFLGFLPAGDYNLQQRGDPPGAGGTRALTALALPSCI